MTEWGLKAIALSRISRKQQQYPPYTILLYEHDKKWVRENADQLILCPDCGGTDLAWETGTECRECEGLGCITKEDD